MKLWKRLVGIGVSCAMILGPAAAFAQEPATDAQAQDAPESVPEGQLTLEDLNVLNAGAEKVYAHNDCVTLVDGTCSDGPVKNEEDAAAVVASMLYLIGADDSMEFVPWRTITDPKGNIYYLFQQMYENTTVCGGAVKVITDADGNMIALSSSVESKMPEVEPGDGITAQEAQQLVVDTEYQATGRNLDVLDQYTDRIILPSVLKFDLENEDESSRFVWVVYTNNPSGNNETGSDLPYLAHYISMTGEYLYSIPAITPDDEAGRSGYDTSYVFEFMEPAEYTGYVDLSDGTEKEITVTLMRDKRTGMYYLGNIERRILVGECYDFLYDGGQVVLESSPDNLEWDQVGLLSLYNYCRAWDYYNEIGWVSGDGKGTPMLILNNFCDDHFNAINNACYVGEIYGMQCFAASSINDYSQCLDVIAHEFTHCVTHSVTTYNSYMNDYGAINEAISDIQGKNSAMMAGDAQPDDWVIASASSSSIRSMSEPHDFSQPEFAWDLYYMANVLNPSTSNDHGGVHFNSSLLNMVAYYLVSEGGMTLDEARTFWFMVDCTMVPQTDYTQLAELLPFVLKAAGMEQYGDALAAAIEKTRLGEHDMIGNIDEDRAVLKVSLPDTEAFDTGNWMMLLTSVKVNDLIDTVKSIGSQLMNGDFSFLPESVTDAFEEVKKKAEKAKEEAPGIADSLLDLISVFSGEETEPQTEEPPFMDPEMEKLGNELTDWLKDQIRANIFSSYGFAGQDGSTLTMVVRPGRTIPLLQHAKFSAGSEEPDQVVVAIYFGGRWFGVDLQDFENKETDAERAEIQTDLRDEVIKAVCGENYEKLQGIQSLDDALDLFTVNIKGGEILELSSEGLDQIVIPEPTPPEEKPYGILLPGPKSRPKIDLEDGEEVVTEEAGMDEAA